MLVTYLLVRENERSYFEPNWRMGLFSNSSCSITWWSLLKVVKGYLGFRLLPELKPGSFRTFKCFSYFFSLLHLLLSILPFPLFFEIYENLPDFWDLPILKSGDLELYLEMLILLSKCFFTDCCVLLYYLLKLLSSPTGAAKSLLYPLDEISSPRVAPQNTSFAFPAFLLMFLNRCFWFDCLESILFSFLWDKAKVFFSFPFVKFAASAIFCWIFLSY